MPLIAFALFNFVGLRLPAGPPPARPSPGFDPAVVFRHDARGPANVRMGNSLSHAGNIVYELEFDDREGRTVPATLVVPKGMGKHACAVFLHGHASDRAEFLPEAVKLGRHDVVSILIDAPFARPREEVLDPAVPGRDREIYLRAVDDCRSALDLLLTRTDTEHARTVFIGRGFGAHVGSILRSVEPRFTTFALLAPQVSASERTVNDESPATMALHERVGEARIAAYAAEVAPLDAASFIGGGRDGSILLQFADRNRSVPYSESVRLTTAAGTSAIEKHYVCGNLLNHPTATRERFEFLTAQLHLKKIFEYRED